MRLFFYTLFFFISLYSFAIDYSIIDKKVSNYPDYKSIDVLCFRISNDFIMDEEKTRAAFTWVALNIVYNNNYNVVYNNNMIAIYKSEYQRLRTINKREVKIVNHVFKSRKANCFGYAHLYRKLCEKLGVKSKVIYGVTKSNISDIDANKTHKDHAWNIVKVNNEWKLVDVTWAAGYQDTSTKKFIKKFNDFYFFTNPKALINHHFPVDPKWQLLAKPISKRAFFSTPIFYSDYFNANFRLSKTHGGTIYVSNEKKIITLFFDKIPKKNILHYKYQNDSSIKKLKIKKNREGQFFSKIKFSNKKKSHLVIFNNLKASIGLKVELKNHSI